MPSVDDDLAWIRRGTSVGPSLASALPPGFDVYGVLDVDDALETDLALLDALGGAPDEVVMAGRIVRGSWAEGEPGDERRLYSDWRYRIVVTTTGEVRRRALRDDDTYRLPDLLLARGRRWMVTTLWDDPWRSIGMSSRDARALEAVLPAFERIARDRDLRETGRDVR